MPGPSLPSPEQPRLLYSSADLLAVAKPAGWHVFPKPGPKPGQQALDLLGWLVAQEPGLARVGDPAAPAVVHRLDLGTSGLVLVARTDEAYLRLREAFSERRVRKEYLTLVEGMIQAPLELKSALGGRYRHSRRVFAQDSGRKLRWVQPAETQVNPLGHASGFSLCRIQIATGVRHQIRAHLSQAGFSVAGDRLYGANSLLPGLEGRLFLHAWRIQLQPPALAESLSLSCPLPPDLCQILDRLDLLEIIPP